MTFLCLQRVSQFTAWSMLFDSILKRAELAILSKKNESKGNMWWSWYVNCDDEILFELVKTLCCFNWKSKSLSSMSDMIMLHINSTILFNIYLSWMFLSIHVFYCFGTLWVFRIEKMNKPRINSSVSSFCEYNWKGNVYTCIA